MSRRARALAPPSALGALLAAAPGLLGQTPAALSAACALRGGAPALCAAAAVTVEALASHVGVAAGLGSEVSGTASNLGQRLGTSPRIGLAARLGVVRAGMPDLTDAAGLRERTFTLPVAHLDATLGLFDGFRIMPTVGGFLALDVFGRAGFVLLPGGAGFSGRASTYTLGARLGIFRESFTLPGVSVSLSRRFSGDVGLGDPAAGYAATLTVDPAVTSLRATVGKDLFAVEVLAGFGVDDQSADAAWTVGDGGGGAVSGSGSIDGTRRLYFVGVSRSFDIVFFLSLEAGVARGAAPTAAYTGDYDPSGSTLFVSAAFRLTI